MSALCVFLWNCSRNFCGPVDDAAGVTAWSIRFCPPTAADFLQTFWFGEVCLLDDVAESSKLGKRFLIALKSNKSRLAATGFAE